MRITFNMQAMQYSQFIESGLSSVTEASQRVVNKRNLLTPEQDPTKYVGAYNIQRMIDELTQFTQNAKNASSWLTNTEKEVNNIIDILKQAKNDLAIAGSSAGSDADSRKALANTAMNLYENLMNIANSSYMGRYIFGGYQTQSKPFEDGANQVTGVTSVNQNGGDVEVKSVFSDVPELLSGKYTAKISVSGGVGTLRLYDEKGNLVPLDSNGSDESGGKGNNSVTELTFEYKPGAVINTGRGISVKMPNTGQNGAELTFNYKAGSEVSYAGDTGSILAQIGYNQDIAMNITGNNIFTQSYKTLQGNKFNTVGGLAATLGTLFSQLDKANSSIGDTISVSGTDHSGKRIGAASILSPLNAKLDLSEASEKERTLTLGYGDKLYKIVVPQAAYKSSDELSAAINAQLKKAEYVGSLNDMPAGMSVEAYKNFVQSKLDTGNFNGEVTQAGRQKYYTDLSGEISVDSDGSRLTFATVKTGDNVRLSVSGSERNVLGFANNTSASFGKDTVFEIGFDPHSDLASPIKTTHSGINLQAGGVRSFIINGTAVNFTVPTVVPPTNTTTANGLALDGTADYVMNIKGREITVDAADLAAAPSAAARQTLINQAVRDAGLASEAFVTVTDDGAGAFNVSTEVSNLSAKDYETAFDKALRAAGFDFGINVTLTQNALGVYDVNFNMVNNNIDKSASLSTSYTDPAATPPTDFRYAAPLKTDGLPPKEKTIGDLVDFVKNLYGETVDVSLENGKLVARDTRSGESRLSLNIKGGNEGVYATDNIATVSGKFNGAYDDNWKVTVTGTYDATTGGRDISVLILDKSGNKIYDKVTKNYTGGEITLPYGIKLTPTDMGLNAADPTHTTAFTVDLKANSALSFGDMSVVERGDNVNIFRSLKNLQYALMYDITKNGFSEPSAWKDASLSSSAKPFLDGIFQGTFNDNWNYEIMQASGKKDFYLQNEYKTSSGEVRFDQNMINNLGGAVSFGVDYYDNKTGSSQTINVNIDLTKANPPVTDQKSMQEYILKTLNDDKRFSDKGVRFSDNEGKIQMESGSGTKIVNFSNNAAGAAKVLTSYIMGFNSTSNNKIDFPLTFGAADGGLQIADPHAPNTGADLAVKQINVPAGTYNNAADLLAAINAELNNPAPGGTNGRIKAEFDNKGALVFKASGDVIVESSAIGGGANPMGMGLTGGVDTKISATAAQAPATNLTQATEAQRTLTFKYMSGVPPIQSSVNITLDQKEYSSVAEMAAAINEKLAAAGIADADMKAVVDSSGRLSVAASSNNFSSVNVEGDYEGFLGFPKAGDETKVKVTDSNGRIVQEVAIDSANKTFYVSDGLSLGFDAGSLKATDSFSAAVGSGIDSEISVLDKALRQVLEASTIVGNRGNRVESVISFNGTVITSNETIKAGYLGSTELDQAKAQTDWSLAQKAYENALTVVGKAMSISLLDFLS